MNKGVLLSIILMSKLVLDLDIEMSTVARQKRVVRNNVATFKTSKVVRRPQGPFINGVTPLGVDSFATAVIILSPENRDKGEMRANNIIVFVKLHCHLLLIHMFTALYV